MGRQETRRPAATREHHIDLVDGAEPTNIGKIRLPNIGKISGKIDVSFAKARTLQEICIVCAQDVDFIEAFACTSQNSVLDARAIG
ncbi:hypothetical protein [Methylorubrum extorquens]